MTQVQKDNLASVINAAIERYPLEDIAEVFIDQISSWKDKQLIAKGLQTDIDFSCEFLDIIDTYKIDDHLKDRIISMAEHWGTFIKPCSLAEETKIEAFMDELKQNPYQLKLIA